MVRSSSAAAGLRRTAATALVAAGALVLPAAAAGAAPSVVAPPAACQPKQSEWATTSTVTPVAVKNLGSGEYTIQLKGSIGGYTARGIESVTVFLDGDYVGRATLSKAQKFSFLVAAQARSWSIDVPAAAGSHELLVCSNSTYSSLAGHVTVVQVPQVVLDPALGALPSSPF